MSAADHDTTILIQGAGIIGLSCALELADRGASVLLYDPVWPPRGASWAAAGMIAPAFEAAGVAAVHPKLFELCLNSAELWPIWSANLEARTGQRTGYDGRPSLAFAMTDEQADELRQIEKRLNQRKLPYRVLEEARLNGQAQYGLELPTDTQVDNRLAMTALVRACEVHERISIVREVPECGYDARLVTAGWESPDVLPVKLPIYPLSGQMISLERGEGDPEGPVRCGDLYIVPKSDRIILGATVEPDRVRREVEPASLEKLRTDAVRLFLQLEGREVLEQWVGVRPGTPDHAPYLGHIEEGLYVAAGHHRNGILLAPLTAILMADLILEGRSNELLRSFSPLRDAAVTHG